MRKTRLLAGAAMLTLLAAPGAHAGTLYAFGDSLSDNGNLFKLTGLPPAPYYEGHFSNGPVWVEYLPRLANLGFTPSNDYAVGGAFTGDLTIAGVDKGTNLEGASLPGITTEIAQFQAAGGSFSANDVVTLWGGANNYFAYAEAVEADPAAAVSLVTSGVTTTITQLTQDTNTLIQLGARMLIVPNLPDLGLTPNFNGNALTVELGNAFSQAHDAALPAEMEMLHQASGANIIVLNTEQLLNRVVADPSLYGFTNVTNACTETPSCVSANTAAQNNYLFWDDVHPTTHAQEIIAEYAAASLRGFGSLTIPGRLATNAAQTFTGQLDNRLNALRNGASGTSYSIDGMNGEVADPSHRISLFLAVTGQFGNRNSEDFNLGYNYRSAITTVGLDDRINDHLTAGLALGYNNTHADVSGGGTVQDQGFVAGLYALATEGDAYGLFTANYDRDDFKTERYGVISSITGKPNGNSYGVSGAVGVNFHPLPTVSVGPEFGLGYSDSSVNSYTETGDSLLTQSVESESYQQLIGSALVNAATNVELGGFSVAPYGSLGVQFLMAGQKGSFSSYFTDVPGVSLTSTYPHEAPAWAVVAAGASAAFTQQFSANFAVASTAFKSDGNDIQLTGNAVWSF